MFTHLRSLPLLNFPSLTTAARLSREFFAMVVPAAHHITILVCVLRVIRPFFLGLLVLLRCGLVFAQEEPPPLGEVMQQAPRVRILSPVNDSEVRERTVTLQVARRGAGTLKLAVNGKDVHALPMRGAGLVQPQTQQLEAPEAGEDVVVVVVPIPPEDSKVSVWSEVEGQRSEAARLRLVWAGRQQFSPDRGPSLYLLAIGVGEGYTGLNKLAFPAKDARDLAKTFKAQEGQLYRRVQEQLLLDGQATPQNVRRGLDWLRRSVTHRDVAVLFIAGHGVLDPRTNSYYFATPEWNDASPESTMISGAVIQQTLRSLPGKVLVFLDTCHAGGISTERGTRGDADLSRFVRELVTAENGRAVFTAAGAGASALEKKAWNNGAFTKAVVEGLSGKADPFRTGRITVSMLDLYVSERVKELTNGRQTPTTDKHSDRGMEDFPLSVVIPPPPDMESQCHTCGKWWFWTGLGLGLVGGALTGLGASALAIDGQLIDPAAPNRYYATTRLGAGLLVGGLVLLGGSTALLLSQAKKKP